MDWMLPVLVALLPVLIAPGLLFHYDSVPKVALLAVAMAITLLRSRLYAGELAALWNRASGKWLCLVAGAQVVWSAVTTSASTRPWFSLLGSNWRRMGFMTILSLSIFAVFSAAHLSGRPERLTRVLRAMSVAAIVVSCYGIAQYFGMDPFQNATAYHAQDGDFTIVRPPSTLGHADYLGWWLSAAMFCAWGLARIERGAWRLAAVAAVVFCGVATILSGTRSAMAADGLGLLFFAFASRYRPRSRDAIVAVGMLGAFVAFYSSPAGEPLRARVHWSADEAIGGARPLLWRDALHMAAAHPLSGFGPETFAAEFPRYQSVELGRLVPDFYHESPHNVALDSLTSEGIPGLLIALCWAAAGGYAALRLLRTKSPLDAALAASFVACIAASLFNALTIAPAVATLTVIAMLVARDSEADGESRRVWRGIPLAASVPVAAALAAFGVMLIVSDARLERFRQITSKPGGEVAAAAYNALRSANFPGAAEDLYCSRRVASACGGGVGAIARLECSHTAMLAAARATGTADNPPNAWYNLAMFAAAQNDGRNAERALRSAIEAAPNWFRPHLALANYLAVSGRRGDAVSEIERAAVLSAGKSAEVNDALQKIAQAR